jgi:hypothetical protein
MKKKILVILPIFPQHSFIAPIAKSLEFLHHSCEIDLVDPLTISEEFDGARYYQHCQLWLSKRTSVYDAFFGFSFGGMILQQCFPLLEQVNKPIVLFSTPTFVDEALKHKLSEVIRLCKAHHVDEALTVLYRHVCYPHPLKTHSFEIIDKPTAAARLIFGLLHVLTTNSQVILQQTKVDHLHLIGACSDLVTIDHVAVTNAGRLMQVPQAGMHVLQDNLSFCKRAIMEHLDAQRG